jgi:hypothetical protein
VATLRAFDLTKTYGGRTVVRGVNIVENEDRRRPLLEQAPDRGRDLVRNGFPLHGVRQVAARYVRNVEQRPERARREQHVAGTPQRASGTHSLIAEPLDHGRLADPGIAGNECHATAARLDHRREHFRQRRELLGTLKQLRLAHHKTRLASDAFTVTASLEPADERLV